MAKEAKSFEQIANEVLDARIQRGEDYLRDEGEVSIKIRDDYYRSIQEKAAGVGLLGISSALLGEVMRRTNNQTLQQVGPRFRTFGLLSFTLGFVVHAVIDLKAERGRDALKIAEVTRLERENVGKASRVVMGAKY